jgi:hypothetical protein
MSKLDYISIFNAMIRSEPLSFEKQLLPIISEYLTEINYENFKGVINLIVQNPNTIQNFIPDAIEYYCRKHGILRLQVVPDKLNFRTILYYE